MEKYEKGSKLAALREEARDEVDVARQFMIGKSLDLQEELRQRHDYRYVDGDNDEDS